MPARLTDIATLLLSYGVALEEPSKGSHWKLKRQAYRVYTIPAHNGRRSEIGDVYIRAMCRHFDIDVKEFYTKLRS